jgi:molybdopterin molybdotransferase
MLCWKEVSEINHIKTPEEALALLLEYIGPVGFETAPLAEAVGRVNYADIHAIMDHPPFDRSPIDGYAVVAQDIAAASPQQPAVLRVTQTIFAGDAPVRELCFGESAQVATGAQLPPQTGCVVKQENTKRENGFVHIFANPGKGKNLIFRGEDVRYGEILIRQGEQLDSAHIGILAGQGFREVAVYRKPKIGLLSTGNELMPAESTLLPGKIFDSNSLMLAARVQLLGGTAVFHHSVEDDISLLQCAISELLAKADVVITTGGVSVGERDFMPKLGALLGAQTLFYCLQYKPGGCVMAMQKDGKIIFCLSGNPFAALTSFELLAAPCLRKLMGARDYGPQRLMGILQNDFAKKSPQRRFVRACNINGRIFLSTGNHGSGNLSTLPGCNCLIDIPPGTGELHHGDTVYVIMFQRGILS